MAGLAIGFVAGSAFTALCGYFYANSGKEFDISNYKVPDNQKQEVEKAISSIKVNFGAPLDLVFLDDRVSKIRFQCKHGDVCTKNIRSMVKKFKCNCYGSGNEQRVKNWLQRKDIKFSEEVRVSDLWDKYPENMKNLRYDILAQISKDNYLIIEIDGSQHFSGNGYKNDNAKTKFVIDNGDRIARIHYSSTYQDVIDSEMEKVISTENCLYLSKPEKYKGFLSEELMELSVS